MSEDLSTLQYELNGLKTGAYSFLVANNPGLNDAYNKEYQAAITQVPKNQY